MKYIHSILFFLFAITLSAQAPDTLIVEPYQGDTLFLIGVGYKNKTNDRVNISYVDQVFDSVGVANFVFKRILTNEERQLEAERIKLQADALTRLYGDVNSILQNFTGKGYLPNAFDQYNTKYIGFYRAVLNQSASLFELKQNGTAVQVDAQGQPVQGGFSGTWKVISPNRFILADFFPTNIVPDGSIFNRLAEPANTFQAVGSGVIITKVRATTTGIE